MATKNKIDKNNTTSTNPPTIAASSSKPAKKAAKKPSSTAKTSNKNVAKPKTTKSAKAKAISAPPELADLSLADFAKRKPSANSGTKAKRVSPSAADRAKGKNKKAEMVRQIASSLAASASQLNVQLTKTVGVKKKNTDSGKRTVKTSAPSNKNKALIESMANVAIDMRLAAIGADHKQATSGIHAKYLADVMSAANALLKASAAGDLNGPVSTDKVSKHAAACKKVGEQYLAAVQAAANTAIEKLTQATAAHEKKALSVRNEELRRATAYFQTQGPKRK